MTSRDDQSIRLRYGRVKRLGYREEGGRSRGIMVRAVKLAGIFKVSGGPVTAGARARVFEIALVTWTQLLQLSSQQASSHPCLQLWVDPLPLSWSCMSSCAQCDSTSTTGISAIAQAPRRGAMANAKVRSSSSNVCVGLPIWIYRVCPGGIFNQVVSSTIVDGSASGLFGRAAHRNI